MNLEDQIIDQMYGMPLPELNDFLKRLKEESFVIYRNTFSRRLSAYFQEKPEIKEVTITCAVQSVDDDGYSVAIAMWIEDDKGDYLYDLMDGIDSGIFEIDNVTWHSKKLIYKRDFNGFLNRSTIIAEGEES